MQYAELHCLSNYSFLRSASHGDELVAAANQLGYQALALTDECSLAGVVKAHVAAQEVGLKLIIGSELRFDDGALVVVLAPDRQAYAELSGLISQARRRAAKGHYRITWDDLLPLEQALVLWRPAAIDAQALALGQRLRGALVNRLWLLAERQLAAGEKEYLGRCQWLADQLQLPVVAGGEVWMHCRERQPLQDLITAIRLGVPVAQAGVALAANAEHSLRPLAVIAKLFPAAWLAETMVIAERCHFSLTELRYDYPQELVPAGHTPTSHLRQLVLAGAQRRFGGPPPVAISEQIERELALVAELQYEKFFLTIHDIVCFARQRNILHQGRGSAANSVICYCLGITAVDPLKVEMLFERFLSRERAEPPDIDVDFEHERREEVIQYIYGKYGRERAALAATVISYRLRSAVRDVGKALAIDSSICERLLASVDRRDPESRWQEQLASVGLLPSNPLTGHFQRGVEALLGFPRHLSQHVGGFVISGEPLHRLVPVENAAMAGRTVIQWDKDDLESLGLLKVDVLALGMLTAIRRCFELVGQSLGRPPLTMDEVVWEQPEVYRMLQQADSVGVFQIESRAQSNMLPRLKPACYYDLVVQIAIVRPGPIQGDMVHPYLRRRSGEEAVVYPNEALRPVLERTLGVPLFQEQVIRLAMVAAGFSAGEADGLRRAMAAWKRSGKLLQYEQKFLAGMVANGYPQSFAEQLFRQIRGFGEYGFPESHSASFALLAYVSAWLKYHYPAAFCCALLNSQPMGFYSPSQLIQDVRRHGVTVLPVDVQQSQWDHHLQLMAEGPALRLGLRLVRGLAAQAGLALVTARPQGGFASLADLLARCPLDRGDREALAAANALVSLSGDRHRSRWRLAGYQPPRGLLPARDDDGGIQLPPPSVGEALVADYRALGVTLGPHPLALLRSQGHLPRCRRAVDLGRCDHGSLVRVAGLVTGRQRPGTASGVTFVSLEDESGTINVVVWLATARAQRQPLLQARLLEVQGVVELAEGTVHVIAGRLIDHSALLQQLPVRSRDFQ